MADPVALVVAGVLALVFMWAAMAKILHPARWRNDLRAYVLPRPIRVAGFVVIPWAELAIAAALVTGWRQLGSAAAGGLLAVFCVAIVRARLIQGTNKLTCGCFGGSTARDYRLMLLRNVAIGTLGIELLLTAGNDGSKQGSFQADPGVFATLLLLLGVVAIIWTAQQATSSIRASQRPGANRVGPPVD